MRRLIVLAGSIALLAALVLPALSSGATQIGHDHFTSDPYPDGWCGIQGVSVDRVVANYALDGSRASINVRTIFTATGSGKSMEIRQTGLRTESAPIDNGDGTYSIVFTNAGQSPGFKLPTGQVIVDTGLLQGVATFDAATDEFLSFDVVKQAGPRPNACDAIIAALS
jgi:hypothetical protein